MRSLDFNEGNTIGDRIREHPVRGVAASPLKMEGDGFVETFAAEEETVVFGFGLVGGTRFMIDNGLFTVLLCFFVIVVIGLLFFAVDTPPYTHTPFPYSLFPQLTGDLALIASRELGEGEVKISSHFSLLLRLDELRILANGGGDGGRMIDDENLAVRGLLVLAAIRGLLRLLDLPLDFGFRLRLGTTLQEGGVHLTSEKFLVGIGKIILRHRLVEEFADGFAEKFTLRAAVRVELDDVFTPKLDAVSGLFNVHHVHNFGSLTFLGCVVSC